MKDLAMPGDFLDAILKDLTREQCPFFDRLRMDWQTLFPDSPAHPAKWENGKLFLHVPSSGALFAYRLKLAQVKRKIAALPGAPKNLKIILEAHAPCFSK